MSHYILYGAEVSLYTGKARARELPAADIGRRLAYREHRVVVDQ